MNGGSHRLAPVLGLTLLALAVLVVVETRLSRQHIDRVTVEILASHSQGFDADSPGEAPRGDSAGPLHDEARLLARRGLLDEALDAYGRVVRAQPHQAALRAEQGYWLLVARQDAEALEALERAARLQPRSAWVALLLGRAHLRLGDSAEAERALQRAVELDPRDGEALLALGGVMLDRGRSSDAARLFADMSASRASEQGALALVGLGHAKLVLEDRAGGHRALQLAVERAPDSVAVRLAAARAWLHSGQPEDLLAAQQLLDETALMAPAVPQLHALRGLTLELRGELDLAGLAYREALRLDPREADTRCRLEALEPIPELLWTRATLEQCSQFGQES